MVPAVREGGAARAVRFARPSEQPTPTEPPMSDHPGLPDVEATLHQLERLVAEAKTVPLSASVMVNRADVDALLAALREALPDELAQARWVVRERDEILERAQQDVDRLLDDARA
jgi:hypothetical protein